MKKIQAIVPAAAAVAMVGTSLIAPTGASAAEASQFGKVNFGAAGEVDYNFLNKLQGFPSNSEFGKYFKEDGSFKETPESIEIDGIAYDYTQVQRGLALGKTIDELKDILTPVKANLSVESVSAINKTGVTLKIDALTEALQDVEFDVKDNNGNTVAVKPVSVLDVGETTVTLTFVTALSAEPVGTWTVNGISFDADAQAAAKAVKDAKNQVELLTALNSSYFTGVNADLIAKYYDNADRANVVTVEDVQKIIDKENKDAAGTDAAKAVKEAKNQVELLAALQNGGFERVNAGLIKEYAEYDQGGVNGTVDYKEVNTPASVQTLVDAVNLKAAEDAVKVADGTTPGAAALTADAINKAQALVSALPEKTDNEKATKKAEQDKIDLANAVAKVKGATTQASLLSALKSPVLNLQNIDDSLAKFYKLKLDAVKDNITASNYSITTNILVAGKTAAINDLTDKISKVTDETSLTDVKGLLTELKRLDGDNFKVTGESVAIVDSLLEAYRDILDTTTPVTAKDETADIAGLINTVNDPSTAVNDVKSKAAGNDADALLKSLKAPTLNLSNVKDSNKDAYLTAAVNKNDVKYFTQIASKDDAQKVVNAVNAYVDANKATTATDLRTALTTFAVALDVLGGVAEAPDFINLSSQAKLEVAEIVLNAKEENFTTAYELGEAVDAAMTAHGQFLNGVNTSASISAISSALNNEDAFPAFFALDAADKVVKAEAVYNKLLEIRANDKDGAPATNFKTIAEIKAAAGL